MPPRMYGGYGMTDLRIRGLVRAMRYVRERAERGVSPRRADALARYISRVVESVEEICRRYRTDPTRLPRPSRDAYSYLAGLATSGEFPTSSRRNGGRHTVEVPGIVRTAHRLLDGLADSNPDDLLEAIRAASTRVEAACGEHGATPTDLPAPSRTAYAMLAYLSAEPVFARYREALAAARSAFLDAIAEHGKPAARLVLRLDDFSGIYRYRRRGEAWTVRLNPGFLAADAEIFRLVAGEAILRRRKEARGRIHAYVHGEAFAGIRQEIDDIVQETPRTNGTAYDLAEVCERVRTRLFDSPADAPASLMWTDRLTYHTFGHYNSLRDRITISRSLDSADVPRYVVEFIMYHELLHKVHGIGWAVSRRSMHTAAFRRDERKFPRYREAQEFLDRLAVKLRRRLA